MAQGEAHSSGERASSLLGWGSGLRSREPGNTARSPLTRPRAHPRSGRQKAFPAGAVGQSQELLLPRKPRAARRLVSVTAAAAGDKQQVCTGGPQGRATRRPTPRSSGCQTGSLQCGEQGHPRHPESKNKPGDATAGTNFLPGPTASGSDLTSCCAPKMVTDPPTPCKALPLTPTPPDAPLFT